ncbi:ArdC family protein [Variovorax ginsengisoli]|uniref:Antirestriction protein ArdC n=1 Tax=Variovorax ginsengisoli TaxID=363844 RepID=A0ABT9S9C3_9BURK|nr:zincin-like metallopeptidase domain-containing protein [Variovorax ginsengisoli]MDP9900951.1 antirestriction protein ArdC [Variovorax ginsengisoli]
MQAKLHFIARGAKLSKTAGVPPAPPEGSPQADAEKSQGKVYADLRQQVTDRIVAMLEKGSNVFRDRWSLAACRGMPCNGKTGEPYHGVNVLLLWDAAIERGYSFNVWLTCRQAASLGGQVRKAEKGVMCVFFQPAPACADAPPQKRPVGKGGVLGSEEDNAGWRPTGGLICKAFWVFNVAQIDGLPDAVSVTALTRHASTLSPVEAAESLLQRSGARFRHGFDQAFYAPSRDEIVLPHPARFHSPENYYATALHELVHWTGHPSRLARAFGRRFAHDAYAFEELIAELGSAFVMAHVGMVDATIEGHAGCLERWLSVLKRDRTAIFVAARHAGLACEYLTGAWNRDTAL